MTTRKHDRSSLSNSNGVDPHRIDPRAIDRRCLLAAAAFTAAAPFSALAASENTAGGPHLKTIPGSGEKIPAIGMGSWLTFNVAGDARAVAQRIDVLRTFFEMGGALIDSSPMYGSSQQVIGEAIAALGAPAYFSADKVWIDGGENGPPQIERSRRHWGAERFDLLQVHNLRDWRAHLKTLKEMKADGRVRYVGVTSYSGLRYGAIEDIMTALPLDFIQITYNIADREAENRLLPLARERDIAVIANRPFREGALIDAAKRHPLPPIAKEVGADTWAAFLLKFTTSHQAITAAIPATRRVDHMRENMAALRGSVPDEALRKEMVKAVSKIL